ncbi:hypothetical protein [Flavivirga jejuensis]|uniref:Uncharacterized protein n=1 Tax=Flavivirga jejuensis TaxID=870487 RepID=A0ABT8WIV4_9FLAO|nr:hypothetical protein [Flavivirga jejuensis]MDO5973086.1 hypothetical protein [Flavivirga jejuensis]
MKVNSQENTGCKVFLEPIINTDLTIGNNKKSVILNYLDESVKNDDPRYAARKIEAYNGSKNITLPNGYVSKTKFILRFRADKLIGYKIYMDIGDDHNSFWDLLDFIKKHDKNSVNQFIYDYGKSPSYDDIFDNKGCKRTVSVVKRDKKSNIYELKVTVN